NPQQSPPNDVESSNSAEANVSGRPQVQEYTSYLKEKKYFLMVPGHPFDGGGEASVCAATVQTGESSGGTL
ncbi:hypothetical protein M9458_036361, partial [Cirrhinus mrigala]